MTPAGSGPPAMDALPVMPSDLQDLVRWLLDQHADLRDALEFADCGSVAKLTALLAQGAAKLHAMSEAGDEDMLLRSAPVKVVLRLIEGQLVPCGSFVRLERSSRRRGVESGSHSSVGRFSASDTPQCQVAMGSTAGHRRGLVVEVAPGVVDGSAVVLPSPPHVITDVVASDVPVFDPMDSDEEDEFDAVSRNATVGHADPQGPIQVDSDDEPMVSVGRFPPWLHADSVPGTAVDSAMDSAVAVSRRMRSGSSREDLLSCRVEATQHDPVSVSVSRQATPPPALALGAHATNQFFSLATDSDDEQPPTDLCNEYISNYRKWLRKLYVYSTNINTSDEDKHGTNYINKNDTSTYTRKLHNQ